MKVTPQHLEDEVLRKALGTLKIEKDVVLDVASGVDTATPVRQCGLFLSARRR